MYLITGNRSKYFELFTKKLVLAVTCYEIYTIARIVYLLCRYKDVFGEHADFGVIPPPFARPLFLITSVVISWSNTDIIVICLFCSVCYLTKNCLKGLSRKLLCERGQNSEVFEIWSDVTEVLYDVKNTIHPIILFEIIYILNTVFFWAYRGIFVIRGSTAFFLVLAAFKFSSLVVMCVFGESVAQAASQLKSSARKISTSLEIPDFRLFLAVIDGFEGFELFDSIVIKLKFLLSAGGCLLTYGILFATFSASSAESDGKKTV